MASDDLVNTRLKHRIQVESVGYTINSRPVAYHWWCRGCYESSDLYTYWLEAWWASRYYRRRGVCGGTRITS